jgi:hypothetical protein
VTVTKLFLATGDWYASQQYLSKIWKQAIGQIIPEAFADSS